MSFERRIIAVPQACTKCFVLTVTPVLSSEPRQAYCPACKTETQHVPVDLFVRATGDNVLGDRLDVSTPKVLKLEPSDSIPTSRR